MFQEGFWQVGEIQLGAMTEATDPCYDKDVLCRINNIPTVPGKYLCYIEVKNEGIWGNRVAVLRIVHEDLAEDATDPCLCGHHIDNIAVDAGLAGFYNNKPDYTDEQWEEFVDCDDQYYIRPEGICSLSGYGDGVYAVYGHMNDNQKYDALEIVFIDDEYNDDDDDNYNLD